MRAGFMSSPPPSPCSSICRRLGANTLVHQRGGATLDGGTNILFEDRWLSTGSDVALGKAKFGRHPANDVHAIFFTSGTTGKPKPIVETRQAWEERILAYQQCRVLAL